MNENNAVLKTEKLRVEFPGPGRGQPAKVAVRDLDLCVHRGEVFGFLGPNGAGKTTTMNVLLGFVNATQGDAWILGANVREPIARQRIGYLPELTYYYKFLTVEERPPTASYRQSSASHRKRKSPPFVSWSLLCLYGEETKRTMMNMIAAIGTALSLTILVGVTSLNAQTVEKVADLNFVAVDGVGFGGYEPLARLTQAGTNLWFTTDKGGTFDAGTISRFDLVTREVVEVASFDNTTGKGSESALLVIGDEGYFTTKSGGVGNAGTIAKVNLNSGSVSVLFNFPANNAAARADGSQIGATPRASLTRIGDELWTTTSLGGTSNRGTIVRYNLTNGVTRFVTDLDGPLLGGQAFAGFTPVGSNAWYYTTFSGGNTFQTTTGSYEIFLPDGSPLQITNNLPLGAGALGRVTFDEAGTPQLTRVADMTNGYPQFPGTEPTLVGTNSLYFGTTGPNNAPGAIIRYDLDTGTWTNLFSFSTNPVPSLAYGTRPGYSALVEWLGELYFLTRQGGSSNLGVVAKFNIASNTVIKLADFEGQSAASLGRATGIFDNTGTIVEETNRFFLYYTVASGGVNNRGTIVRVALPPPPIVASLAAAGTPESLNLSWTGGYPPFTVQGCGDLAGGSWTNVVENLTTRTATLPISGPQTFFRVLGSD